MQFVRTTPLCFSTTPGEKSPRRYNSHSHSSCPQHLGGTLKAKMNTRELDLLATELADVYVTLRAAVLVETKQKKKKKNRAYGSFFPES
jgi:hypothetical protein